MTPTLPVSDGTVTLRGLRDGDAAILVAGRDTEFHRFMGEGRSNPTPTAIIEVGGEVVGWVDYDHDATRTWLDPDECNVGYHVFAPHRSRGIARRAVGLLLTLVAGDARYRVATFLIDPQNAASLRVAAAVGATERERLTVEGRPQVLMAVPLAASSP